MRIDNLSTRPGDIGRIPSSSVGGTAQTASLANTSSFVQTLNQAVVVSGSLSVIGSQTLSGSFNVEPGTARTTTIFGTASHAQTASYLSASVPTYVQAKNSSAQAIPSNVPTTITNWVNTATTNAAEWNPATGVFTATKDGTYQVSAFLSYEYTSASLGRELNTSIWKNSDEEVTGWAFVQAESAMIRPTQPVVMILKLVVGDTIRIRTYQNMTGGSVPLINRANANLLTIQELPSQIIVT